MYSTYTVFVWRYCTFVCKCRSASESPLASQWSVELPGFESHALPKWEGWLVLQSWSSHKWERCYAIIENMHVAWYANKLDGQRGIEALENVELVSGCKIRYAYTVRI